MSETNRQKLYEIMEGKLLHNSPCPKNHFVHQRICSPKIHTHTHTHTYTMITKN